MNFDFSDDQKLLRDQARKFLHDKCDRSVVRSILEDSDQKYSKNLWNYSVKNKIPNSKIKTMPRRTPIGKY